VQNVNLLSKFTKVDIYNQISQSIRTFHAFPALEDGATYAGYAALIERHELAVPAPDSLCAIGTKHRKYKKERWQLFTPRHKPEDTLQGHLTFALKYEGIDLTVLNVLFDDVDPQQITNIVKSEPTGAYSRRIWFLYEWLTETTLELMDATQGNFVPLINDKFQYAATPRDSRRHRVRNNLPGTREFCPLIRRTQKLDQFIAMNLSQTAIEHIGKTHKDLLSRAAAFLLLKDSKASYTIEGEAPPHNRIERWGKIIGEAGQRKLSVDELEFLQSMVITDSRFTLPGCRLEGGFVGDHDRITGMPMPVHISARADDLESLLSGLVETYQLLSESNYDAVLTATLIAFGFVFIHPFEDGNGRIHRYLFHHVLAENGFVPKGLVFPVSAVILDRIDEYKQTLEHYSKTRLDLIEWRPTDKGNVEVLNQTINLYRYFDATKQAEFFFECVQETVNKTLPEEVDYLTKYDLVNDFIKNYIDMPDKQVDLLIRFLIQNDGRFSNRARDKEFAALTVKEVQAIENKYDEIFHLGEQV
jgi:Fic family protein